MQARQLLGWVLVTLLALFVVFNQAQARVWVFGMRIEMPVALVVIFSSSMGAGAGWVFARMRRRAK